MLRNKKQSHRRKDVKMRKIILTILIMPVFGLFFNTAAVRADLIIIGITGEVAFVDDTTGLLEGNVNVNDIVTGIYTYDLSTPDSNPSLTVGDYEHFDPPCGISLTVGGLDFRTDPNNVDFLVEILNDHGVAKNDAYVLTSYNNLPLPNGALVWDITWQPQDPTGKALSSIALPTTAPVLADWPSPSYLSIFGTNPEGNMQGPTFGIVVEVTSVILIPEPGTLFLFVLGGLALRKSVQPE